jgi:hypothetical protein
MLATRQRPRHASGLAHNSMRASTLGRPDSRLKISKVEGGKPRSDAARSINSTTLA